MTGDALEGVLTLYAREPNAFTDAQRQSVETAARPLAHMLRTLQSLREVERLTLPGLAESMRLADGMPDARDGKLAFTTVFSVPLQLAGPAAERHLALVRAGVLARRAVGGAGQVYLDGDSSLLVLVTSDDTHTTAALASRLKEKLAERRVALGVASSPADGRDAASLMQMARRRAQLTICPPPAVEGIEEHGTAGRQQPLFDPVPSRQDAVHPVASASGDSDEGPPDLSAEVSTG